MKFELKVMHDRRDEARGAFEGLSCDVTCEQRPGDNDWTLVVQALDPAKASAVESAREKYEVKAPEPEPETVASEDESAGSANQEIGVPRDKSPKAAKSPKR